MEEKGESLKFWRYKEIEALAERRLGEYERLTGRKIADPPVPIDLIIENEPFDLSISWEEIEELPGETILGGLRPLERQIVMNERHLDLFGEKPGLERSTKGHELGHWDLFVDKAGFSCLPLPGLGESRHFLHRQGQKGIVEVIRRLSWEPGEAQEFLHDYFRNQDDPHERRAVDYYSSCLLMPRDLIRKAVAGLALTDWPTLYSLAESFKVTISALCVRLEKLGLIYIKDREIYPSREEAFGQGALDLGRA